MELPRLDPPPTVSSGRSAEAMGTPGKVGGQHAGFAQQTPGPHRLSGDGACGWAPASLSAASRRLTATASALVPAPSPKRSPPGDSPPATSRWHFRRALSWSHCVLTSLHEPENRVRFLLGNPPHAAREGGVYNPERADGGGQVRRQLRRASKSTNSLETLR